MNRYGRCLVTLVVLMGVLALILTPNLEVSAVKGVSAGNTFTYGRNDGKPWIVMDPSYAPIYKTWEKFENMSTMNFVILPNSSPDSDLVVFNRTIRYQNQSSSAAQGFVNVQTGAGDGYIFFVSTELVPGGKIYPVPVNENFTWTVNETRIDPYWGGRQIYFFNHTAIGWEKEGMLTYVSNVICWDKLTGVLLSVYEARGSATGYSGSTIAIGGTVLYELISNNIGIPIPTSSSSDLMPIIVAAVVIFVVAIIVIVVRLSTAPQKKKWKRLKE